MNSLVGTGRGVPSVFPFRLGSRPYTQSRQLFHSTRVTKLFPQPCTRVFSPQTNRTFFSQARNFRKMDSANWPRTPIFFACCAAGITYLLSSFSYSEEQDWQPFSDQGDKWLAAGELDKALADYKRSLDIVEKIGDEEARGKIYVKIGDVYERQENYKEAFKQYKESLKIFEGLGDQDATGRMCIVIGNLYGRLKKDDKAIEYYKKGLHIAKKRQDTVMEAKIYRDLSVTYGNAGEYSRAIKYAQKSVMISQEIGDRVLEEEAYYLFGTIYGKLGQFQKSIEYFAKDLEMAQLMNYREQEGEIHAKLASNYLILGKYREAREHSTRSLDIAQELKDPMMKAKAYITLGLVYKGLGEYQEAVKCLEKNLGENTERNDLTITHDTYGSLAIVFVAAGEYAKARECFENCLRINKERKDWKGQRDIYNRIGEVANRLGEYEKAIEYHEKSVEWAKESQNLMLEEESYSALGDDYTYLQKHTKAIDYCEKALQVIHKKEDLFTYIHWGNNYSLIARNYALLRNWKKAIEYYKKTLEIYKEAGDKEKEGKMWTSYGWVLLGDGQLAEAEHALTQAIDIFNDLQFKVGSENDQGKIVVFEQRSWAYNLLQEVLIMQNRKADALRIVDFSRSRALVDFLRDTLHSISPEDPIIHGLSSVQRIKDLASFYNTSFVFYSRSIRDKNDFHTWIVPPKGEIYFYVTSIKDLACEEGIVQIPAGLTRGEKGNENTRNNEEDQKDVKKFLQKGYQALITPIEEVLPRHATVTFLPDRSLHHIPFAILQDNDEQYLVEKYTLSTIPSIETLWRLEQRRMRQPRRQLEKRALIVGDPWKDLPSAYTEAKMLKELLQEEPLLREEASVNRVKEEAPKAHWLHFACHGKRNKKTNDYSVFEGVLGLAPYKKGLLYSEEIQKLPLQADLAFLSACQSGKGKIQAEGVIGLTRSFLAAGVNTVIATHWRIPDEETVHVVAAFYKQLAKAEKKGKAINKAEALRYAMLSTLEEYPDMRDHPEKWGAFFLVGLP